MLMSNWTPEEKAQMKQRMEIRMAELRDRIMEYRELTKPIPPENAIGRVSRMDAINNRSVNEAALRQVEKQLAGLDRAMGRLHDDRFGLCHRCGEAIPFGRILLLPGATSCVRCSD
jgi:DnaK suppressor protein